MDKEKGSFWSDGLSIDETKFSVLVLSYFVAFIVLLFMCAKNNDIETVEDITGLLLTAVFGINIAKTLALKQSNTTIAELNKDEQPKG